MSIRLRLATIADAPAVAATYAPYVRDTAISFELEPPDEAEMARRIGTTLQLLPWLVAEADGAVIGYAYAGKHRERAAYQWSVDVSVYLQQSWRGKGAGRRLYTALFAILRAQGYVNAYGGITLPNERSVGLHEAMGFRHIGTYEDVGYKHGRWHPVGWWALRLCEPGPAPAPPIPLPLLPTRTLELALQPMP